MKKITYNEIKYIKKFETKSQFNTDDYLKYKHNNKYYKVIYSEIYNMLDKYLLLDLSENKEIIFSKPYAHKWFEKISELEM